MGALSYSLCFCWFPPEMLKTNTKHAARVWGSLSDALNLNLNYFKTETSLSTRSTVMLCCCYTVSTLYLKFQLICVFFPGERFQWCGDVWSWARAKNMPPKSSTPKNSPREVSRFPKMFWTIQSFFTTVKQRGFNSRSNITTNIQHETWSFKVTMLPKLWKIISSLLWHPSEWDRLLKKKTVLWELGSIHWLWQCD